MAPERNDRTPHKAPDPLEKEKKIPRPPNAWIIYRTARLKEFRNKVDAAGSPLKQADISRMISLMWAHENPIIKKQYEKEAEIAKVKHAEQYPDYKYQPVAKAKRQQLREEAKAAKKRAQDEAKAAKAAGRRAPARASPSSRSPGQSSQVKLEDMLPVIRGSGPSPPIDSDDESSMVSSTPSLPSEAEAFPPSPSTASSGLEASQSLSASRAGAPDHLAPFDHYATQPQSFSLSSSYVDPGPLPAPNPSYPNGFMTSADDPAPLTSMLTDAGFLNPGSTPSDSPPSYTEGDFWQMPGMNIGGAPLQEQWSNHWNPAAFDGNFQAQYLQPNVVEAQAAVSFDLPTMALSNGERDMATILQIMAEVNAPPPFAPVQPPPPGELDLSGLTQAEIQNLLRITADVDNLAPALGMNELQDAAGDAAATVSDFAADMFDDGAPFHCEDLTAFAGQFPMAANEAVNSGDYFGDLIASTTQDQPDLTLQQFGTFVPEPSVPLLPSAPQGYIPDGMADLFTQHTPDVPPQPYRFPDSAPPSSAPSSSVLPSPVPPAPQSAPSTSPAPASPAAQGPVPAQSAQPTRRYVPPSGAGLGPRRRVGQRYPFPPSLGQSGASGSGSGSA